MQSFQNCLDYFHLENLEDLISKVLPRERSEKRTKMNADRAAYSLLLSHTVSQLERIRAEAEKNRTIRSPALIDMDLISPVSNQILELTQRQCTESSTLIKIIFTFYKQSLIIMELSCQEKIKKTLMEYFRNLEAQRKESELEMNLLKDELTKLRHENQEKWKTFYMIVKDNRVLRRQKGKLMRSLQEQKVKLCGVHQEMMQVVKENQKTKLLTNYHQSPEAISLFLKNSQAISKLEHFMRNYPKETKKLLNVDLTKLEVSENISLDEKIMYIIKTAKQSEEIFDEYEDLIDVNERPNKLIFNISTQTDPFDTDIDPPKLRTSQLKHKKHAKNVHSQTTKKNLELDSNVILLPESPPKRVECNAKRRKALKTNLIDDLKLIDAVRHFKQNCINSKVCNIKIISKNLNRKPQNLQSNVYNLAINQEEEEEYCLYPELATNHKLQFDIKRSKEMIRKEQERRSSRKSSFTSQSVGRASIREDEEKRPPISKNRRDSQEKFTSSKNVQIQRKQLQSLESKENKLKQIPEVVAKKQAVGQTAGQKYLINSPQIKRFSKKANETDFSLQNKTMTSKISELDKNDKTVVYPVRNLNSNKHRASLKDFIRRTSKQIRGDDYKQEDKSITLEEINATNLKIDSKPEGFQLPTKKEIRKSGFAAYKRMNTLPVETTIQLSTGPVIIQSLAQTLPNNSKIEKVAQQNQNSEAIEVAKKQVNVQRTSVLKIQPTRNTSMLKVSKEKVKSSRVKVLNIYSIENSKLLDKIYKHIYLKRKQISDSAYSFENFLNSYMVTQYGPSQRVALSNHLIANRTQKRSLFLAVADVLLDNQISQQYLQHLFRLFAKILLLSNSDSMTIEHTKGKCIEQQLYRIHFSQQTSKALAQKHDLENDLQAINICQLFLNLDFQLRSKMQCCQLLPFLKKLLPNSQKSLIFQQIKEIFQLFVFQQRYYHHLITLKRYCNSQITVQNLCFYAIREDWQPLLKIEDFITHLYNKIAPSIQENESFTNVSIKDKCQWTQQLIKQKEKNWNNETLILTKYLKVLQINSLLSRHTPISPFLAEIQNQTCVLKLKQGITNIAF